MSAVRSNPLPRVSRAFGGGILMLAAAHATHAAAETVTFPGDGVTLEAQLFRPQGAGPFPAVVALHGCSGLYERKGERLSARHADWAERLSAEGFLVLLPDSFTSRGLGPQCRVRERETRPSRERVADALAAKAYLQTRPDVKAGAISLLGWSNGGSTVLYAVEPRHAAKDGKPDFAVAIAFYPGCRVPAESGRWHTRLKLHILIGGADDWTPAAPCESLANTAQGAGESVAIKVYPGAYHDFDHPNQPVHLVRGLAFTGSGTGAAHSGTDPASRADAIKLVPTLLAR
jgi:dienelactone hydrolase